MVVVVVVEQEGGIGRRCWLRLWQVVSSHRVLQLLQLLLLQLRRPLQRLQRIHWRMFCLRVARQAGEVGEEEGHNGG